MTPTSWRGHAPLIAVPLVLGGVIWALGVGAIAVLRPDLDSPLWYTLFAVPLLVGAGAGQGVGWKQQPFVETVGRIGGIVLAFGAISAVIGLVFSDFVFALIGVVAFLAGSALVGMQLTRVESARPAGTLLGLAAIVQIVTAPLVFGMDLSDPWRLLNGALALAITVALGIAWIWAGFAVFELHNVTAQSSDSAPDSRSDGPPEAM